MLWCSVLIFVVCRMTLYVFYVHCDFFFKSLIGALICLRLFYYILIFCMFFPTFFHKCIILLLFLRSLAANEVLHRNNAMRDRDN